MFSKYSDVIEWLEKESITEPDKIDHIINTVTDMVAAAFSKPRQCVINLSKRESFDSISREEGKILNFYFKLLRKYMG